MSFNGKTVFLVGSYRSGTTWLQLLLNQHPAVASCQETFLFSQYLAGLDATWRRHSDTPPDAREAGLPSTLTRVEFEAIMRDCAENIFRKIASSKLHSKVIIEKTPSHIHHWELIMRLFPDAHFLHIIRDPRSVVCSLMAAGRGWGSQWAPTNAIGASNRWITAVRSGQKIRNTSNYYKEVFYEKLLTDGPSQLKGIFTWLNLETDLDFCENAIKICSIDNLKAGSQKIAAPWQINREPLMFYRHGSVDSWRTELSRSDLRVVEYLAGELMDEFSYPRALPPQRRKPLRLVSNDAVMCILSEIISLISRRSPHILETLRRVARST